MHSCCCRRRFDQGGADFYLPGTYVIDRRHLTARKLLTVQQLKDLASGERSTVLPKRMPHVLKQPIVKELSEDEMREAAQYFSRLKTGPTVVVKESATAPKIINRGMFFTATEDGALEVLGNRIVEVPEDLQRFEVLRDDQVKFNAYVPLGSVAKGMALARAPGGNAALA